MICDRIRRRCFCVRAAGLQKVHEKEKQREDQDHSGQHLRPVRRTFAQMGHHPDAHAHPDGRGKLSGWRYHPPGRGVCPCECRRQNAQIGGGKSGGIHRFLCKLREGIRCGHPYFGQQQAFVLLPERKAGGGRI